MKTEYYNRCCVHHVRLRRLRCPTCCLCQPSCETGAYLTLCDAAIYPPCLSIHTICRPVLIDPTLTTLIPSRPCAHLEHICACTRNVPVIHPAVYLALSETATSDLSQSRQQGSHLAEHKTSKSKSQPPGTSSTIPPCAHSMTVTQSTRLEPEEENMTSIHDVT
jgi:hypothetical protein